MFRRIQQHLGWKIFLSYLVIILVGIIVLATSTEVAIPSAFDRHMSAMMPMMGEGNMGMGMMETSVDFETDLFASFRNAVNEALTWAALAAFLAAVVVSIFISRQVVTPVREMMIASQYIANGHYEERVRVPGNLDHADELAQLALSFNRMAEKLDQTETMRRQLIGDISHELRTPLTTIKGSMEGLIDGVLEPAPETFQQIQRETERLQRLVTDLQELSRVEAGTIPLKLIPSDIGKLVDAVCRHMQNQFDDKGVDLRIETSPEMPLILVDEDRISQVLINLVGNALQYTPEKGQVSVVVSKVGNEIHMSVKDTGIGLPVEHLSNVFTRFYRVDKSRSRAGGGSGIGLTIAKHLIEAHGGRIWVESKGTGKGSTFTFSIPLAS
ncbi:MAG: HAMP domain-containing protein [Chloroflexi bacterium]|nr:HAMP domain-containing protein [Chloroflexota bacterium]